MQPAPHSRPTLHLGRFHERPAFPHNTPSRPLAQHRAAGRRAWPLRASEPKTLHQTNPAPLAPRVCVQPGRARLAYRHMVSTAQRLISGIDIKENGHFAWTASGSASRTRSSPTSPCARLKAYPPRRMCNCDHAVPRGTCDCGHAWLEGNAF